LAGRGELTPLNFLKNGRRENFLLIDESYNANPTSIQSALDTLVNICSKVYKEKAFKVGSSRRIAVLGDMLEMGDNELREHIKIKDLAVMDKVDIVHCVGFRMQVLYNELPKSKRGLWTKTSHEMLVELVKKIKNGDIIVVKGSFSMNMNQITIGLKELEKVEM
jgi:UDP-N-acetylmuramoyl-tripeptide--D-alanyl-D-alanine ligase